MQELVTTLATRLAVGARNAARVIRTHWRPPGGRRASAAAESSRAERDASRLGARLADLEKERTAVPPSWPRPGCRSRNAPVEHDEASERHERLLAELDALLADHPGVTTVAALLAAHRRAVAELDEARAA